jgi:hypothetical protein
MLYILLKMLSLLFVLFVLVRVARFSFEAFVQNVGLVKANTAFLQFLEVSDMVKAFENIVFKLPHVSHLLSADFGEVL